MTDPASIISDKFSKLPLEILQKIASFSTPTTVLKLRLCNKHLNSACYSPGVFREMIKNLNGFSSTSEEPWDISFLPSTTTASELARYALADFKTRSWDYPPSIGRDSTHPTWAPHLAVLGHPFLKQLDLYTYLTELRSLDQPRSLLGPTLPVIFGALLFDTKRRYSENTAIFQELHGIMSHGKMTFNDLKIVVSCLAGILLTQADNGGTTLDTPSMERIPCIKLAKYPPVPFTYPDGKLFDKDYHIPYMTSKHFIEDGEWSGYYSYDPKLSLHPLIDPPMLQIKLRVSHETMIERQSESGDETATKMSHVSGSGVDNVGQFTLSGAIYSNGSLWMSKVYNQGVSWDWTARMTPLGIMGHWTSGNGEHLGWIWLWKRTWSA